MKHTILALALILGALPASAGSLTFAIQSTSPAFSGSKAFTIPDADMAKFYAWVQVAYPAPPCVPVAPATTCTTTPYTLAQSLVAWASGLMAGTVANVQAYMRDQAAAPVAAAVAPISAQ